MLREKPMSGCVWDERDQCPSNLPRGWQSELSSLKINKETMLMVVVRSAVHYWSCSIQLGSPISSMIMSPFHKTKAETASLFASYTFYFIFIWLILFHTVVNFNLNMWLFVIVKRTCPGIVTILFQQSRKSFSQSKCLTSLYLMRVRKWWSCPWKKMVLWILTLYMPFFPALVASSIALPILAHGGAWGSAMVSFLKSTMIGLEIIATLLSIPRYQLLFNLMPPDCGSVECLAFAWQGYGFLTMLPSGDLLNFGNTGNNHLPLAILVSISVLG